MGVFSDQPGKPFQLMPPKPGTAPSTSATQLNIRQMANAAKQRVKQRQMAFTQQMATGDAIPTTAKSAEALQRINEQLLTKRALLDRFVDWVLLG